MHLSVSKGNRLEDIPHDVDMLTMGINPSKKHLHPGHYLTMGQSLLVMEQRRQMQGLFLIDDRELHSPKRKKGAPAQPVYLPPEHVASYVEGLVKDNIIFMSEQLGDESLIDRINVVRMSAYMRQRGLDGEHHGTDMYRLILENLGQISANFGSFSHRQERQNVFRPACQGCSKVTMAAQKVHTTNDALKGACNCKDCQGEFSVDVSNGDSSFLTSYVLDPLRDARIAQENDKGVLHVFGGDYAAPWGIGRTSKADRLSKTIDEIAPRPQPIHHFTGPMLTKNGQKLAKSNGDRGNPLTIEQIQEVLHNQEPEIEFDYHALSSE